MRACVVALFVSCLIARPVHACVGTDCMEIWSTEEGGGSLVMYYDFEAKPVQTLLAVPRVCTADTAACLYTSIDPGFMAPPADESPGPGYHVLVDGTKVILKMAALDGGDTPADAGAALQLNGRRLSKVGDTATIGTMPNVHNHPSWLINVPGSQVGEFRIAFQLTTDSGTYGDSPVYTAILTNVPPAPQSPTPTQIPRATPTPGPCVGDCSGNGVVVVSELVTCVNMALERVAESTCPRCDADGNGHVSVNELVAAVNSAIGSCPKPPPVTLAEIETSIFTPRCATQFCHDATSANASLILDADHAYDQLVGVAPTTLSAQLAGLLRVAPGDPSKSFLLVKLNGPPPDQGSRMPLGLAPLSADEIDLITQWIQQGASRD